MKPAIVINERTGLEAILIREINKKPRPHITARPGANIGWSGTSGKKRCNHTPRKYEAVILRKGMSLQCFTFWLLEYYHRNIPNISK